MQKVALISFGLFLLIAILVSTHKTSESADLASKNPSISSTEIPTKKAVSISQHHKNNKRKHFRDN